jgi:hypothetical protein
VSKQSLLWKKISGYNTIYPSIEKDRSFYSPEIGVAMKNAMVLLEGVADINL